MGVDSGVEQQQTAVKTYNYGNILSFRCFILKPGRNGGKLLFRIIYIGLLMSITNNHVQHYYCAIALHL